MELNQALGLNLTPSALSLEVNGPDGSTIEIDSDSALTSFLRKNLKRAEQLPEQEFILSAKEARKRRGKGTVTNDVTWLSPVKGRADVNIRLTAEGAGAGGSPSTFEF